MIGYDCFLEPARVAQLSKVVAVERCARSLSPGAGAATSSRKDVLLHDISLQQTMHR